MKTRQVYFTVTLFLITLGLNAQNIDAVSNKELKKSRPVYINFSAGFNNIKFRDLATSPLFYRGTVKYFEMGYRRGDKLRDTELGVNISTGSATENVSKESVESNISSFQLHYSRLYQIHPISDEKMNYMVGGLFATTTNIRQNAALMNNAVGMENFSSLMASMKATRDFSKVKGNTTLRRELSLRLNIGLMNNSFRNGYIYTNSSSVLNNASAFDGHEVKMFSGFRMSTELDYTIFLQNKNAIKFSYVYEGLKSGGDYGQFGMTNNILKATFLFGTKK
ncbi:hypothetical protein [Flammeovirga pacifica]|uniref:Outer membrane protein beta-barrel domain-containing protein n=1 Tax=Flammeovirga pacifica TaxID=915059 RepID=A0A1S1YS99_FLAPC|nr:hypothetical protein [Flammeovirga pacifica]OHX63886.1 hypothetical protein NH26_19940 [Flammeovirga pacifica]